MTNRATAGFPRRLLPFLLFAASMARGSVPEQERPAPAADPFFENEVWGKVGEQTCLNCHVAEGDAGESRFLLRNPALHLDHLERNRDAFVRMASLRKDGSSRILLKPSGAIPHGGGVQLKPGSTGYRILERFVRRLEGAPDSGATDPPLRPFFEGVLMVSPQKLLRRITLSLAGRLPSAEERATVEKRGQEAIDGILDRIMTEEAFTDRLKEGFNDIFLTLGYSGVPEDALSSTHFSRFRTWYGKHDLSDVPEKERRKAADALTNGYRNALLREPLELITYVVRNERPFTEIVTADYFMASPYTARGYGIFEQIREEFQNTDDPFEFVPAKLAALKGHNGKAQESATGFYPHAGLLSMFQYLRRYPTTETNRNRLRARMYYKHFLGIDVMKLAPRVADAAAVGAKFANPTLQAPDCVVCHKTIDPVAGLFQDYFNEEGHFGPRKEGWFRDMVGPGREGQALPPAERWRALQWLGQETVKDPRFAVAMVEHVYYILMGRRVLEPPQDIDDPLFTPKRRAHQEQRREIREAAARFAKAGFNLKVVFKALIASPFYRVDGPAEVIEDPSRRAELEEVGIVHLLTPEQLERKIEAVFGQRWGMLAGSDKRFAILYGGIDSKAVTERMSDPSGAMGAIQRIMANEVASRNVAKDFGLEPARRRLFPKIELNVLPGGSDAERKILEAIGHLHELLLGRSHAVDHPEVRRTYKLFAAIVEDARTQTGASKRKDDAPHVLPAWRAVVTYLLRQDDFLYE